MTDIVEDMTAHSNAFNAMSNAEWMALADAFLEASANAITALREEVERLRADRQAILDQAQKAVTERDKENEKLRAALGLWRTAYEAESLVGLSMAYDVTVPPATQEKSDDR